MSPAEEENYRDIDLYIKSMKYPAWSLIYGGIRLFCTNSRMQAFCVRAKYGKSRFTSTNSVCREEEIVSDIVSTSDCLGGLDNGNLGSIQ